MYLYLWIIVLIISIVFEIATASALISIWFAAGALGAIVASILSLSLIWQIIVFFTVSVIFLIIFRPLAVGHIKGNFIPTNADRAIGRQTELISEITQDKWGQVKLDGVVWNVTTIDSSSIKSGTMIEVLAIEGSKLIVKKL